MKVLLKNFLLKHPKPNLWHKPAKVQSNDRDKTDKNPQYAYHYYPLHDTNRFDHSPNPLKVQKNNPY